MEFEKELNEKLKIAYKKTKEEKDENIKNFKLGYCQGILATWKLYSAYFEVVDKKIKEMEEKLK